NNCLDCSLSALSSFFGVPAVSAPRTLDQLPDGTIDRRSGEIGGTQRAEAWLGEGLRDIPGLSVSDQFAALHA
ncbi:toxin glutamine deamidase domain-containing protein, partial [Nocardia thailandica]